MFEPKQVAAFDYARKLTLEPQLVGAADIDRLREHFSDAEIIEMTYHVSRYNGTERWTDATGIPQDERASEPHSALNSPTSEQFSTRQSKLLPESWTTRPTLESRSDMEAALSQARTRESRVALPDTEQVRQSLPADLADQPTTSWKRAVMQFPTSGASYIRTYQAMQSVGKIPTLLKAQLAWIAARHDRAWYALGDARRRLNELGVQADQQYALDAPTAANFSPAELAAFAFTEKLTVSPQLITDADVAALQTHYSDFEVAEIIAITCSAATFDRFTESLGLKLEE
jgi:alkylhydroperoxidase family enzyme